MDITKFADEFGPEKVLEVYDPKTGMRGFTVVDNTALGPGKGGIRMTSSVSVEEVFRLARAMTWKCALADLPFGGGKSGIIYDNKKDKKKKDGFMRAFARAISDISPEHYVAAPDINTSEKEMMAYVEENGHFSSTTGKPLELCQEIQGKKICGLPHELGSTGEGVAHSTEVALRHKKIDIIGATVAIEGFGNVGTFAFKQLQKYGAKIVAVSDSKGVLYNEDGIDYFEVMEIKKKKGSVVYGKGKRLEANKVFELDVDVLIPAALPDVINKKNWRKVKAQVIVEAANIPIPHDIEEKLFEKGIMVVPDFVANAGGVISSYAEYIGEGPDYMRKLVKEKLNKNTDLVLARSLRKKISPRSAGMEIALLRVRKAMKKRDAEIKKQKDQIS